MKLIKTETYETTIDYIYSFEEWHLEQFNHEVKDYMVDGDMVRDFTMEDVERLFDHDRPAEPRCLDEVHTFEYSNGQIEKMTIGEKMLEVLEQMTFDNYEDSEEFYGNVINSSFEKVNEDID